MNKIQTTNYLLKNLNKQQEIRRLSNKMIKHKQIKIMTSQLQLLIKPNKKTKP